MKVTTTYAASPVSKVTIELNREEAMNIWDFLAHICLSDIMNKGFSRSQAEQIHNVITEIYGGILEGFHTE